MSNLLYWVVPALAVTMLGVLVALIEKRPQGPTASVDNFAKKLTAMSSMKTVPYDGAPNDRQKTV